MTRRAPRTASPGVRSSSPGSSWVVVVAGSRPARKRRRRGRGSAALPGELFAPGSTTWPAEGILAGLPRAEIAWIMVGNVQGLEDRDLLSAAITSPPTCETDAVLKADRT